MVTTAEVREDFLRAVERARTGTPIDPKEELQRAVERAGGGRSVVPRSRRDKDEKSLAQIAWEEWHSESAVKARLEAEATKRREAEARAKAELERARREAIARESARRETARKTFEQALKRAKEKRSMSAQREARKTFEQGIRSAKESRKQMISQAKKVPKVTYERSIINEIKLRARASEEKFAKSKVGKIFDVIFGGTLRDREFKRQESKLNEDIEKFNKRYGGRELSESEFNRAKRIETDIIFRQENIKEKKEELAQEFNKGIKGFIFGGRLPTKKAIDNAVKKHEKDIMDSEEKLKKGGLSKFRRKSEIQSIKFHKQEINRIKAGGQIQQFVTGTVPISPVGVPVGIPKTAKVSLIGTRKIKGNKMITDVVFKVGKKRVGIAKGVTIAKGKTGTTFTLGKSGIITKKFPTGTTKVIRKQTFAGIEKGMVKPTKLALRGRIQRLTIIKKNIKGFKQGGFGRVISAKGDKLFKAGKKVKGFRTTDFASVSNVLTKKDLDLIIGKTITTTGNKAKFIAIIKGTRGVGKLTGIQKSQYQIALKKVVSTIASASAKADKVKGLTKTQQVLATQQIIKGTFKPKEFKRAVATIKPKLKPKPKLKTRVRLTPAQKQVLKSKPKIKNRIAQLSEQGQRIRQRMGQLSKAKQKAKTKQAQQSLQKQKIKLKSRLKEVQLQKQTLTQIHLTPRAVPTPTQMKVLQLALPKRKKRIKKMKKPKKPKPMSYHVYARPLKKKGKKKPKLIRVTKKPIKKKRAKDLRNYLVDTSLSRTAKIKSSPRKPSKRILKAPTGYASKTQKKFRKHKIVKGKKKPLRSGKVIEKKRHLLDTKQEKKKIGLKRRIAQLHKQSRVRTPVGKPLTPQQATFNKRVRTSMKKRKPSQAQLDALAKGRAKLKRMRENK